MRKHFAPPIALENEVPVNPFVFLGGTCNDSEWRDELIKDLNVEYFDPRVFDVEWNEECAKQEELAKVNAKALIYVITPKQSGTYSLVELAVSACLNKDKKVIIIFLNKDDGDKFDEAQMSSNKAVQDLLQKCTNAEFLTTLSDAAAVINQYVSTFEVINHYK